MAEVEIKLNSAGVREMLRSPEMKSICEEHANKALGKLGAGYEVTAMTGKNRVNASVCAMTHKAKKEQFKSNTILKALRGGDHD